jgi:hypothetical protein
VLKATRPGQRPEVKVLKVLGNQRLTPGGIGGSNSSKLHIWAKASPGEQTKLKGKITDDGRYCWLSEYGDNAEAAFYAGKVLAGQFFIAKLWNLLPISGFAGGIDDRCSANPEDVKLARNHVAAAH